MKKLAFILFLFLLCANADASFTVPEDFYLNNSGVLTDEENVRILPNTLRLVIPEGESGELFAESYPGGGYCNVKWNITGDGAKIFPRENTCTVLGVSPCRETVTLSAEGKEVFGISVEVKPKRKSRVRSFEYEGKKEKEGMSSRFMDSVVVLLGTCGILFLICAAAMFKGEENEE